MKSTSMLLRSVGVFSEPISLEANYKIECDLQNFSNSICGHFFITDFIANWQSLEANYNRLSEICKLLVIPSHARHSKLSPDDCLLKAEHWYSKILNLKVFGIF